MLHQPRKRFGQHFLRDPQVLNQLQEIIQPLPEQRLIEIGPGEGVLTKYLLAVTDSLDVIEIDRDLANTLKQRFPHVVVHNEDVLKFDFSQFGSHLYIVGNLPYNISSPLLFHLFQFLEQIDVMCFMLQKEVVLRMTAAVGEHNYNRLSVMTQYYCDNEFLFEVSPEAFFPPPQVDSAVVAMHPRTEGPRAKDIFLFSTLVQTAFNYRRKTLHNSLRDFASDEDFNAVGLDPKQRPQELTVIDFVKLTNFLYDKRNQQ